MDVVDHPLLTVAIPTWNRGDYLEQTLAQLAREARTIDHELLEVIVSDNASGDRTPTVVAEAQAVLEIRSVRNSENIGSDANIAQCFNLARGDYVLILGDDDLLIDGCLAWLLDVLARRTFGVICLRAYGFDGDFRREYPGDGGGAIEFKSPSDFFVAVNSRITLISSNVLQKALIPEIDARSFCGGNLVQVHLALEIGLKAPANLYVESYKIACKRNNSGGYDFTRVFVSEFGRILDQYRAKGLSESAVRGIEDKMLFSYLPYYFLRQRLRSKTGERLPTDEVRARLGGRPLFWVWVYPILALPRPLAIGWGSLVTALGRIGSGDLRRGVRFLCNRVLQGREARYPV
ncbi:glycosyltransferase family 2 protein [Rhodopseudomonas palustris]|nr:glycosyltransferase family 2 protein [Rhodopseudomonas palustris]RJF63851.1 glycosyltransferase family 2 protein [Rhodopseudomonas palustris]